MRHIKALTAGVLSLLLLLPIGAFSASAASDYTNDFSGNSMSDFDTTTANALIKDGTLQLKKGDGDAAVVLKTEKYENFTLEVDISVTDENGGAPFILFHTQEINNPFQGGTYTAVIYPTDVKGCFFAPYHDNGWIRQQPIYQGNTTFHLKVEVYNNYATFYADNRLLGAFGSGTEFKSGYVGLGSYRAAVSYDNLKVTPSAPAPGSTVKAGTSILSDDFAAGLGKKWVSKTMDAVSVSGGNLTIQSNEKQDRYVMLSENITETKYVVETIANPARGNSGLLVKGGYDSNNIYEGYSFTYDAENSLMKASRYFNGYVSMVENIRVAPISGDYTMSVMVDGDYHAMYVNGQLMLEFIDDTFRDGNVGYMTYDGTASFTNLKVSSGNAEKPVATTTTSQESTTTAVTTTTSSSTTQASGGTTTTTSTTTKPISSGSIVEEDNNGYVVPLVILIVLVVLGGAGAAVYFLVIKKKQAK